MAVSVVAERAEHALLEACKTIRKLLAQAAHDEILCRHRVGALLSVVRRTPGKYGEHAVERLSAELGIAAPTLYRYAAVAECWSEPEVREQAARTNRFGATLAWSHFTALTSVSSATARQALADECLAQGWTVRRLVHLIKTLETEDREHRRSPSDESVRVALTEGIQTATRALVDLDIFAEALESRLSELDAGADEELVLRAISAVQKLHARTEATLDQLRQATHSSQTRLRCAVPARSSAIELEEDDESSAPVAGSRLRRSALSRAR
jgi:hypothetical protein